ncbi:hypothetical protein Ahy_A01g002240 [Arachis hypogaea]|uniref:50S ribosomal protein L14, chloroplastic n=1 Tax=Arachis hypogaea TaxID=3818 RepID=A0A445EQB4_ARAHY|nr:hypothetical protein Ahy_A01g002240 [Arachis hypogaea]
MSLERSEVIRAVIVRTCKELKCSNGMIIQYDDNAAVVIDQEGNPKGTRIFGAIARELRQLNFTKIVSLAPEGSKIYWIGNPIHSAIQSKRATLGGMFLCGANDLITIFVAPECFSLCSYLLSGYTKKDVRSNEATTKYLLMGGASSSILVHGFSWLYGSSGGEIELQEIVNGLINTQMYNSPGISIALIFITVGIGFKLSPAPSHQWTPDVYEGVRFVR